jgi:hypothetical protein
MPVIINTNVLSRPVIINTNVLSRPVIINTNVLNVIIHHLLNADLRLCINRDKTLVLIMTGRDKTLVLIMTG